MHRTRPAAHYRRGSGPASRSHLGSGGGVFVSTGNSCQSRGQEDGGVMPFLDLQAQYMTIKDEIGKAIAVVLDRGDFVLGGRVEAFEHGFAAYCVARYWVAVTSGSSVL